MIGRNRVSGEFISIIALWKVQERSDLSHQWKNEIQYFGIGDTQKLQPVAKDFFYFFYVLDSILSIRRE